MSTRGTRDCVRVYVFACVLVEVLQPAETSGVNGPNIWRKEQPHSEIRLLKIEIPFEIENAV